MANFDVPTEANTKINQSFPEAGNDIKKLQKMIEETQNKEELNHVAKLLLDSKTEVTEEVKIYLEAARQRLELNIKITDSKLINLQNRYDTLETVLQDSVSITPTKNLSNTEKLKGEMSAAKDKVVGYVQTAWKLAQTNVLKPMIEKTKDIPIIGSLIGMIGEVSPKDVANFLQRKWYELLSAPASILGEGVEKKWYGGWINTIANDAKKNLMILDAKEAIEEAKTTDPSLKITLDTTITPAELKVADKTKIAELVTKEIQARKLNGTAINIRLGSLFDTKTPEQIKLDADTALKTKMLGIEDYKQAGINRIEFSTTETSFEDGLLKVSPTDITDGIPITKSKLEALLAIKKEITNATKIIVTDPADKTVLDWSEGKKLVKIPTKSPVDKNKVNVLLGNERANYYSILEIGNDDNIPKDGIEIAVENGKNKLKVRNDTNLIAAIIEGKASNLEAIGKYKFVGGGFTMVAPPVPVTPSVTK